MKPYSLGYDVESASVNCSNRDIHGGYHTRFTEDTHSGEPNNQERKLMENGLCGPASTEEVLVA